MQTYRVRIVLWSATAALLAGAAAVIAWAKVAPTRLAVLPPDKQVGPVMKSSDQPLPLLKDLQSAFSIELRRPLVDTATAPSVAPNAAFAVKLSGTVIEPGHCRAILQRADGKIELKQIGDDTSGGKLLSIEPECVTLLFQGQTVTLNIEKKKRG